MKRFEFQEAAKAKYLKGLTIEKSIKMVENLTCFANELRRNFFPDSPFCLKIGLRKNTKR